MTAKPTGKSTGFKCVKCGREIMDNGKLHHEDGHSPAPTRIK